MLLLYYQYMNKYYDDTSVGIFYEYHVKIQNSLVLFCKKKSRQLHRVKSEEFKGQTANRISKNIDLRERQQ